MARNALCREHQQPIRVGSTPPTCKGRIKGSPRAWLAAGFNNNVQDQQTQRQMQIDQLTNAMQLANNQYNNQASQQAMQTQAYLRSLPLNEINALRTGSQVQGPQFGQYYTNNANVV